MGKLAARFALLAVAISIVILHCEAGKNSFGANMKKHTSNMIDCFSNMKIVFSFMI